MLNILKTKAHEFSSRPLWQRRVVFGCVGAIGGFAHYYFIGCASGACPISSNPYISTAYGTMISLFVPRQNKKSENLSEVES